MHSIRFNFKIVNDRSCPLYELGDIFTLSDRALFCPKNKAACLILVREMTSLLFELLDEEEDGSEGVLSEKLFSCSGCLGLIKFRLVSRDIVRPEKAIASIPYLAFSDKEMLTAIRKHPLIRAIPEGALFDAVSCFRKERLEADTTLIVKGQLPNYIYLLLSGEMTVSDEDLVIATLRAGDICGEMSYFGGEEAGVDVKTVVETVVLSISADDFSKLLDDTPELQFFMTKTLVKRLSHANAGHVDAFGAGMCGWLNEMPPAELLQVLHMNQKTGVLDFEFADSAASVLFEEGEIVGASYEAKKGKDAVYAVLKETIGRYIFTAGLPPGETKAKPIGEFMMLLMEGVKNLDEGREE